MRYRDNGSVIHGLNPFCKLAWAGGVLFLALVLQNPLFLLMLFFSTLPVMVAARVWREWTSYMKFAVFLCLAIVVINALVSHHGAHILAEAPFSIPVLGTPVITLEAVLFGLAMAVKLLAIISAFAILTLTLSPDDMMLAMVKLRLPYRSVLVTALSTRFLPALINDAARIADVQRTRGVEAGKGWLHRRVKARMSVVIPLLSNSLDRAVQIAEAMESRAFGNGTKRTFYRNIPVSRVDLVSMAAAGAVSVLGIVFMLYRHGDYQFYPSPGGLPMSAATWAMLAGLVLIVASPVLFGLVKRRAELD
ncbi:MAG: energy-coupling factor transporter transmembrane protein EcfT [Dehalococcoidia bacterium]|nr:energy-coupling factor transporter transmembrane protein EcfT [Dehalococcoidia bacterium]